MHLFQSVGQPPHVRFHIYHKSPTWRTKKNEKTTFLLPFTLKTFTSSPHLEVEAKFQYTPQDEQRISKLTRYHSQQEMIDTYWDHPSTYPLTSRDLWLRQRNSNWELKVARAFWKKKSGWGGEEGGEDGKKRGEDEEGGEDDSSHHIDNYVEIEDASQIISFLRERRFLSSSSSSSPSSSRSHSEDEGDMKGVLEEGGYTPFATIKTIRKIFEYTYREEGEEEGEEGVNVCNIVLDRCEPLNYLIGEIEIIVAATNSANDDVIHRAESRIQFIASHLGVSLNRGIPGKVLHYIHATNPRHWSALEASHLLRSKRVSPSFVPPS